ALPPSPTRRSSDLVALIARRRLFALAAVTAAGFAPPVSSAGQATPSEWRPRTVPLFGASYSPDVGLLLGAGLAHTRYGFRALPPSTRLLATAEYGTGARTYRATVEGEFRRPVAPAVPSIEM